MSIRRHVAMSVIGLLVTSGVASSQSNNDVTFRIPVNLTRLSPELASVSVNCSISSSSLPDKKSVYGGVSLPVVGGQVQTTATVVVAVPPLSYSPFGPTGAGYECTIWGVDKASRVHYFQANGPTPESRVSPTPPKLTGNFMWETLPQP
jgi:hypothetical protein